MSCSPSDVILDQTSLGLEKRRREGGNISTGGGTVVIENYLAQDIPWGTCILVCARDVIGTHLGGWRGSVFVFVSLVSLSRNLCGNWIVWYS